MRDDELSQILREAKTIAVVGLSPDQGAASYGVAKYLQRQGYRIVPVNPNASEVLGEKAYPDLLSIPFEVDVVDIFRRPESVGPHVEEAIQKGVKAVWMQLGIRNEQAAAAARNAGLPVVMDRCMKIEHYRLFG
ncbi:MAG: CoA-binding protein [Chloroflexaceae bacterium]|jgi:hypothetical protein|nr:CoA-binding protein [Chloroflexaceae bacterium]